MIPSEFMWPIVGGIERSWAEIPEGVWAIGERNIGGSRVEGKCKIKIFLNLPQFNLAALL